MITTKFKVFQFARDADGSKRWLVSPAVPGSYVAAQWLSEREILHKEECTHKGYVGYMRAAISEATDTNKGFGLAARKQPKPALSSGPSSLRPHLNGA
jgi:hypothetical protein